MRRFADGVMLRLSRRRRVARAEADAAADAVRAQAAIQRDASAAAELEAKQQQARRQQRSEAAQTLGRRFPEVDSGVAMGAIVECNDDADVATTKLAEILGVEPMKECQVCLDQIRAVRFGCGHACCCEECALRLLDAQGAAFCPACRAPISRESWSAAPDSRGVAVARQATFQEPSKTEAWLRRGRATLWVHQWRAETILQRARSYALTNYLRHVLLNRLFLYAVATTILIVVYRSGGLPRVVWLLLKVAIFMFAVILGFYICAIAFILACVDNILTRLQTGRWRWRLRARRH